MNDQDFTLEEGPLAEELGVARAKVRTARSEELTQGHDWKSVGGVVRYTRAGWEKLLSILKISSPAAAAPPVPLPAPAHSAPKNSVGQGLTAAAGADPGPVRHGDVRELAVVRVYAMNRRMLLARLGGSEVRCRVQDNRHFTKGMVFPAKFLEADLWIIARRGPRFKGKW